ncbi:hypothetical protein OXX69_007824 [Metschnikowia pulcherrima]
MINNLLSLPFWLCDDIPLENLLSDIINRDFYQPATAFEDLKRAQALHTYVVNGAKEAVLDPNKYEVALTEFYYLIKDVEAKFPDHVVTFEWYDTFHHRPQMIQVREWRLEQRLLIFQTGLLYSHKAHLENVHAEEGLKKACAYFQQAAGCFEYLLERKTADLGPESSTIQCMHAVMISSAQELIWQKAVRGNSMKDTVIARLAVKVAEFYADAAKYAQISSSVRQDWINLLLVKSLHFRAAAHFRMSNHALDTFEYGVQVSHLRRASEFCKAAQKHKRYVSEYVLEDLAGLQRTVQDSLATAEKDNDLVYLKPVPDSSALPAIVGVSMVTPKPPNFLLERDASIPPAFSKLMPFAVVQVSQAFRERQDAYIETAFHEPLQALNKLLRQFLAERQLPASLDSLQVPESIPDSIGNHAQEILSLGGIRLIEESMAEISTLAAHSRALVSECEERLCLEQKEDDLMREREGSDRWTRTPSQISSKDYWAKIEKMRDYLAQGQASDGVLGEIYKSIQFSLEAYCGGPKKLSQIIPQYAHVPLDRAGESVAFELRDLLAETAKLETKRERFAASINLKSRNHSILSVVIDNYKKNPEKFLGENGNVDRVKFEPVYEKHIAFFDQDLAYLAQSKDQQIALEKKIDETNQKFSHVRAATLNKAQESRLQVLQKLEADYVTYLDLVQNLNQASKFYTSFLERGNNVLRELDAYLLRRREEARELVLAIREQRNFEGIENSMSPNRADLASPRAYKANTWDPSKGIKFG